MLCIVDSQTAQHNRVGWKEEDAKVEARTTGRYGRRPRVKKLQNVEVEDEDAQEPIGEWFSQFALCRRMDIATKPDQTPLTR